MDLELTDRVAIVTGGSRGIGKAIARQLALEGADVAIVARDAATLEQTANELREETGRRVLPLQADTGDDAPVRQMVSMVNDTFGRIDVLVNAAAMPGGQTTPPKLAEIADEHFWA